MRPAKILLLILVAVFVFGTVQSYGRNDGGNSWGRQRSARARNASRGTSSNSGGGGWGWKKRPKHENQQPLLEGYNNQNRLQKPQPPPRPKNPANCKSKCSGWGGQSKCSNCCRDEGRTGGVCTTVRRRVQNCECS